jgi:acetolactate synthase-1/3 small subunit
MTLGDYFERELLIVKVKLNTGADKKILPIINEYKGEIIDDSIDSFTIQLTDNVKNIDNFLSRIINLGDLHAVARSGSVSVTKGQITLSSYANQNLSS